MKLSIFIIAITFYSCSGNIGTTPARIIERIPKMFKEPLNTAVFATKFIVIDKKDIITVRHEPEDGRWTFFSNDEYHNYEEVAKVVSLGQMIEIDSTILQIADMPRGYYAVRSSKQDTWKVEKLRGK